MADENNLTTLAELKRWLKPKPAGSISALTVVTGGTGYTSVPTVTITDAAGVGVAVTAILTDGVVTGFTIDSPGNDYVAPTVTITGGGGTGATASAATGEDAALQKLINDVSSVIMGELPGLVVTPDTVVTEVHRTDGGGILVLRRRPVTEVTAVAIGSTAILVLPDDADQMDADYQWRLDGASNTLHLYAGVIGNYRDYALIGGQNVVVTYKAGLPVNDLRLGSLERAAIATATLWWKRSPYAHVSSESASQGMGTSISINTGALPDEARLIIKQLNRDALAM